MDSIKKAFMLSVGAVKLFVIMAIFNIILNVVNLAVMPVSPNAEIDPKKTLAILGTGLVFFLLTVLLQGGIVAYIRDLVKTGSANLKSFAGNCGKYFLRMMVLVIITLLIVLGWGLLFFGVLPLLTPSLKLLFVILGTILIVGLVILLILPAYALVGSELGAVAAIRRGVSIAFSNFLQVLVILIVLLLIGAAIMFMASFITGILTIPFKEAGRHIAAVVLAIASAIVTLVANTAYMDFYLKKS